MPVIRNPFRRAAPSTPLNTSSESVITENLSQSTVSLADSGKLSAIEDVRPPRLASAISIPKGPDEGYKLSGGYPSCSRMCMDLCAHPNVVIFYIFYFLGSLPEARGSVSNREEFYEGTFR